MEFPTQFIAATRGFCTFEQYVPAPLLRKSFSLKETPVSAELLICGLGFYDLFLNGERITKGPLAPYISAPDDLLYYDRYDVAEKLCAGENVIGVVLGNGMQNSLGGYVWDFEKARWRGSPEVALSLSLTGRDGRTSRIAADESFRVGESPICFDDLRCGEYYDARKEQPGWASAGFDDSGWRSGLRAPTPRGEARLCEAEPIVVAGEISPVSIAAQEDGFLYDFGVNTAGVCRLTVAGTPGQKISLEHGETLADGKLYLKNIQFVPDGYVQKDIYICRGGGTETHEPRFTYHGFRYVLVKGVTPKQATEKLLTCRVMHSGLREAGGFSCSDAAANALQRMTRRSTLSNFYYFPTDCPHREKNGWTGDASVSCEHTLLNLTPEKSYREWLRNIRKAQNEQGALPGIVPTGGWGFEWGNGPAWDSALVNLPYFTYIYRGDTQILTENATAIFRYLNYLSRRRDGDGLVAIGLGDWCAPGRDADKPAAPLIFTDSVIAMDICEKAAFIFGVLHWELQRQFARGLYRELRGAVRARLIDFPTMTAAGCCQTSQAMAIFYNVLEPGEKAQAFDRLLKLIEAKDGHMDTGILGARVIFHVLSDFGRSDLAFHMITRPDYPSYGNWVARGATTLWEDFQPEGHAPASLNHHFFGDISGWFIQCVAGIRFNPHRTNHHEVHITPAFLSALTGAQAFHIAPAGKISAGWKRDGRLISLTVQVPPDMTGRILLPEGYSFADSRMSERKVQSGTFNIQSTR